MSFTNYQPSIKKQNPSHIWHPCSQMKDYINLEPMLIKSARGSYIELYNEPLYKKHGITQDFIQDDISTSGHNVLRGIHGDSSTWKLVSCLYGEFYLVVVNNDPSSN